MLRKVGVVMELCKRAHLRGGTPPPTVQSSVGLSLIQLESVSTGLQRPLAPHDPEAQVEVLPHLDVRGVTVLF